MKKSLLLLVLSICFSHLAFCQDYLSEYQQFFKGLQLGSKNVPKTIDLAAPQINPVIFNGLNQNEPAQLDQAEELVRSLRYTQRANIANIPHWDSLLCWTHQYLEKGIMPLLLVDFRYESLSDSFWIRQQYFYDSDSNFLVKKGPWHNGDFHLADAFCFIPMVENINPEIHSVILDSRFYISHRNASQIPILGGDIHGHNFTLIPNQPVALSPLNTGINNLLLFMETDTLDERVSINKGIQLNAQSAIRRLITRFHLVSNPLIPSWKSITNGLNIEEFKVSTYVTGENGSFVKTGANVSIHYSSKTKGVPGCLNKPIVFVEGIDFGYRGWPTGCRDGKCGNTGYIDLLKGKQWDVESQSWTDWHSIENGPTVVKEYRDSGYDIVYIDFWDGADYIENNAVVTKEAIKQIQQRLCGDHIHVLGASMGALVAKRALTMLENDTQAHCVRSYTSFDGPHLGANIPLGLQATLQYYSSVSGKICDLKERMLNRPASKQMLLVHYQNIDKAHEYRNRFMADSTLHAFPVVPWRFAIINGSSELRDQEADNLLVLTPGDSMLHFNIAQPLFDNIKSLAKLIGGKTLYAVASVLPESDAKLFTYSKAITIGKEKIPVVATFKTTYQKETPYKVTEREENLDHIAGGMSDAIANLHNALRKQSWIVFSEIYTSNTCFIPTWSAIASDSVRIKSWRLKNISESVGNQFLQLRNTPFHNYHAKPWNQDHVYFDIDNGGNARWLLEQLRFAEKQNLDSWHSEMYVGRPYDRFIGNVQVETNQTLNINGPTHSTLMNPSEKTTIEKLKQRVFYLGNCQSSNIQVNQKAKMILYAGSNGKQPTQLFCRNNASITVESGSTLQLHDNLCELIIGKGCHLNLRDGATLIVENGAKLIFEENSVLTIGKNVTIQLNGEQALMHMKGQVTLAQGATFKISCKPESALGLMKWSNVQGGFGRFALKGQGDNIFYLEGNDATASTVLQIEGDVNHNGLFDSIFLNRAHVRFGNHSKWTISGVATIKNSGFDATEWSTIAQNGLSFYGGTLHVNNSQFRKLNTGLQWTENSKSTLTQTTFEQCMTAVVVASSRFRIEQCTFKKNTAAVEIHGNRYHDSLTGNNFTNNTTAITVNGDAYTHPLHCNENTFYANTMGIETQNRTVALRCNIFGYNTQGINATECAVIAGAHSGIMGEKDTLICGNNTFAYSLKRSINLNFSKVFMDGENNFLVGQSNSADAKVQIAGTIPNLVSTPWNTKNSVVNLGKNHWFPLGNKGTMDSVIEKYLAIGALDIGGKWFEISVQGSLRTKVNTLCFDPQNALDVARRSAGLTDQEAWMKNETPVLNTESMILKIPCHATVYGMDGREIARPASRITWSEGLSTGFYLVRFQQENGDWISRRIFYVDEQ